MMHLSLCGFGSGAVLQLAEQMTSVDVVGNRCGSSCMADVLPKLVVTVLSCYNTCDVRRNMSEHVFGVMRNWAALIC